MRRRLAVTIVLGFLVLGLRQRPVIHAQVQLQTISPSTAQELRDWDATVNRMLRANELQIRSERADTLVPGRTIQQLDQYVSGVRVWGGTVSRQLNSDTAISVFGSLYSDVGIDLSPTLTQADAKARIEQIGGTELGADRQPQLVILPDDSGFRLTWVGEIATFSDYLRIFLDAHTGDVALQYSLLERQLPSTTYVGHGIGVLGDDKKISTSPLGGGFIAFDTLRPPDISTYDLVFNFNRAVQLLNGVVSPSTVDYARTTSSDEWTDGAVVDAHVYSSVTYDYYYKRFGRRGLDNADKHIWNITHAVRRSDAFIAGPALTMYWTNAFYANNGMMYYGEGLPDGFYLAATGNHYDYFSGAIDIVAHELTHGVTGYSSQLEYRNESGALNESFSDMMGTSVEFYFHPPGNGPLKADYLLGEDISRALAPGALDGDRSLENPALYGQPDHYSRRRILPLSSDNGGVHTNSGISNQAFYLAIEGGTNRTSGIRVQGVGGANRDQIEKIFYRGFTQLMPSSGTFAIARLTTLQAAQDLYGLNSPPYNAVRDAWTAVGVN